MALLKRNPALSEEIPEDVRERARRAGAEDFDWYAGRLNVINDDARNSDTPAGEREELEAIAERHRTESGASVSTMTLFRSFMRLLPGTARRA
jgi:hypothetical protein